MNPATMPVMGLREVAEILDVTPATVTQYRSDSRPGFRYGDHPFPAPDGFFGKSPWWVRDRRQEIEHWSDDRPGRGRHMQIEEK